MSTTVALADPTLVALAPAADTVKSAVATPTIIYRAIMKCSTAAKIIAQEFGTTDNAKKDSIPWTSSKCNFVLQHTSSTTPMLLQFYDAGVMFIQFPVIRSLPKIVNSITGHILKNMDHIANNNSIWIFGSQWDWDNLDEIEDAAAEYIKCGTQLMKFLQKVYPTRTYNGQLGTDKYIIEW